MPETAPATTSDTLLLRQHALLLSHLAAAPDGTLSQSEANTAAKPYAAELGLAPKSANALREAMGLSGWLTMVKVKRNVMYTVTEAGRERVRELDRYLPLAPAGGKVNPAADERARLAREAYVLDALAAAPDRTIGRADLDVGFGGRPKVKVPDLKKKYAHVVAFRDQHCLTLNPATARAVLADLALRGDVAVRRAGGSESYTLTPAGEARLRQLRGDCPVLPPTGRPTPAPTEAVRQGREAFVLLKLLQSAKYTLWGSDAAVGSYPKPLKLNHATAWAVRTELADRGYVTLHWDGQEGCCTLTPAGKRYLATLPFDALGEVKVKGSALTDLLAAARGGGAATTGPGRSPASAAQPTPSGDQLAAAVMDIFTELLRERFTVLDMVPIHEIRRAVAERFGPQAASHAVLDETLLELRRRDILRLISISDRSRATPEQLQDSVPGVGETFFYARKSHAPAHTG